MARKVSAEMNNYFWFRGEATFLWLVQAVPVLSGHDSLAWKSWTLLPALCPEEDQGPTPQSTTSVDF